MFSASPSGRCRPHDNKTRPKCLWCVDSPLLLIYLLATTRNSQIWSNSLCFHGYCERNDSCSFCFITLKRSWYSSKSLWNNIFSGCSFAVFCVNITFCCGGVILGVAHTCEACCRINGITWLPMATACHWKLKHVILCSKWSWTHCRVLMNLENR